MHLLRDRLRLRLTIQIDSESFTERALAIENGGFSNEPVVLICQVFDHDSDVLVRPMNGEAAAYVGNLTGGRHQVLASW